MMQYALYEEKIIVPAVVWGVPVRLFWLLVRIRTSLRTSSTDML